MNIAQKRLWLIRLEIVKQSIQLLIELIYSTNKKIVNSSWKELQANICNDSHLFYGPPKK